MMWTTSKGYEEYDMTIMRNLLCLFAGIFMTAGVYAVPEGYIAWAVGAGLYVVFAANFQIIISDIETARLTRRLLRGSA